MEYIKKEELIIGEIYNCANISGSKYIVKIPNNLYNSININKDVPRLHKMGNFTTETLQWSLATPEEKHWLETCIKLDKFITFEEAMKTFIPEYVEILSDYFVEKNQIGKIYKITDPFPKHLLHCQNYDWDDFLKHKDVFKPSTKEAYDAQFVVIEPAENKTELEIWLENTKSLNLSLEDLEEYIESGETCNFDNIYMKLEGHYSKGRAKILFDKWNEKVIEPLPQFKVIETIETITKVENNEGNQFFIGDEVIGSKTKIKSKIISFKYNVDKTAILAITDKTSNIGIGINHLEHYIEPKKVNGQKL